MESIIYRELKKRGYSINVGVVPVIESNKDGTRTRKQFEVDFIAVMGNEKIYVKSAYNIYSDEKLQQESNSFLRIDDSFRKIMIEGDLYFPYKDKNGIEHIGVIDFLCDEKYNQ